MRYDNILDAIGNTPIVKINKVLKGIQSTVYAKLESLNPGHSAKDRIALFMIEKAEKDGILKPGGTVIETTSGNTGFSLAMISVIKGYRCILCVPDKISNEKLNLLRALKAEVAVCPSNVKPEDPRSYYSRAKQIHQEIPNSFYVNQYFNEANTEAHYCTTGPEIWKQTEGKITHYVASCGTGGSLCGTAKYLKEQNPNIQIIGVDAFGSVLKKFHETGELDPEESYPYRIEGLGKNLIPTATDFDIIDDFVKVNDEDSAHRAREIALKEGLFAGYTSGAAMQAVMQLVKKGVFNASSKVVVIFPDHGSRYMTKIYSDTWMHEQGFFDSQKQAQEVIEYIK